MADSPIGITFMPSADAAANGPRQASIEGQGGSDLAQAFKILSLHLPNILGAGAIAPKRLLTSQGSAGVGGNAFNPYSAVFQSLLQSMGAGGGPSNGGASLASLFGSYSPQPSAITGDPPAPGPVGGDEIDGGVPSPRITPGKDFKPAPFGGGSPAPSYADNNVTNDTQYI